MNDIYKLTDYTLIIVSQAFNFENCDRLFKIENNKIWDITNSDKS